MEVPSKADINPRTQRDANTQVVRRDAFHSPVSSAPREVEGAGGSVDVVFSSSTREGSNSPLAVAVPSSRSSVSVISAVVVLKAS